MLTQIQRDTLLRPIKPSRVKQTQGNSYLEAWDVTAYLTKVFGFEGWSKEVIHLGPIFETPGKSRDGSKDVWTVAYRCDMRLTIRDPEGAVVKIIDDVGTGEAINQPSRGDAHDLAAKSAVSSALKRCAKDLGDQFGLGLYNDGSTAPCLGRVVIYEGVSAQNPDDGTTAPVAASEPPEDVTPSGAQNPAMVRALSSLQRSKIYAQCKDKHVDAHEVVRQVLGLEGSINSLTPEQASTVINYLNTLEVATA
jgi:hypothetical protein